MSGLIRGSDLSLLARQEDEYVATNRRCSPLFLFVDNRRANDIEDGLGHQKEVSDTTVGTHRIHGSAVAV